jgi:hypothetical protein
MRELVSPEQAETIVRFIAIGLVAAGIVGAGLGALLTRRRRAAGALGGLAASAGVLVYALWLVYNSIIARLGLDSVKALLINLAIFAAVGLLYGIAAGAAWRWSAKGAGITE